MSIEIPTIGVQQAREQLRERIDVAIERGEHTIIARHGRQIAVLVPYTWYATRTTEETDIRTAIKLIHDAMDADDASYHERETGIIDTASEVLAQALLKAGWRPPTTSQADARS